VLELAHTVVLMCTTSRAYLELQGRQFLQISTIWLQQQNCASFLYMYRVFSTAPPHFQYQEVLSQMGGFVTLIFFKKGALVGCYLFLILVQKIGRNSWKPPCTFCPPSSRCSAKVVNGWLVVGWYGETFGRISTPCPTSNQPPLCIRIMI